MKTGFIFVLLGMVALMYGCDKSSSQGGVVYPPASSQPTINSTTVTQVTTNSALCGATITSQGSSPVISRGICYGISSNPTIADLKVDVGNGVGVFTTTITGLFPATFYYFRPFATNSQGTTYGSQASFTTQRALAIGGNYGGGKIFYLDQTGEHGLIVSSNNSLNGTWGCTGFFINGISNSLGSGQSNTNIINVVCSGVNQIATICNNLVSNGYSDWYAPSKDELNLLFLQKNLVGPISNIHHWSSSQGDLMNGWTQNFADGSQRLDPKSTATAVRAIRSF